MPSKGYVFTYFDITAEQPEELLKEKYEYLIYQLEKCPTTLKFHYQGYVYLKKETKLTTLANYLKKSHVELRRGTHSEAKKYCMKEDSKAAGPWEFGCDDNVPQKPGERTDLNALYAEIKTGTAINDIIEMYPSEFIRYSNGIEKAIKIHNEHVAKKQLIENFEKVELRKWQLYCLNTLKAQDDRKVLWIVDAVGNTGKTFLAKYIVANLNGYYCNNPKTQDAMFAYSSQKYICFDYTRDYQEYVNYGSIEAFKNGIAFSSKYQSTTKVFEPPKIIIFANFHPNEEKLSLDRWKIIDLDSEEFKRLIKNFI